MATNLNTKSAFSADESSLSRCLEYRKADGQVKHIETEYGLFRVQIWYSNPEVPFAHFCSLLV